jgi:hypothetical protein
MLQGAGTFISFIPVQYCAHLNCCLVQTVNSEFKNSYLFICVHRCFASSFGNTTQNSLHLIDLTFSQWC